MDPQEVKLSRSEELKVIVKALESSLPWKRVLLYTSLVYINYNYIVADLATQEHSLLKNDKVLTWVCAALLGPLIELVVVGVVGVACYSIYEGISKRFKKYYDIHKTAAQEKALEKVDEEILK